MQHRIIELEMLAAEEGIRLPMPAAMIVALEETGAVVDLVTGAVIADGAAQRFHLTVVGDAVATAARAWGDDE